MTRNEMLIAFEAFLSLPVAALNAYVDEDTIGGFNFDPTQAKWPGGSLWAVEGEALYALVRALKPNFVLELGTHRGCSTSHLAAAVVRNGFGRVITVDVWEGAGDLILPEVRGVVEQRFFDALDAIHALKNGSVNFVFEDLLHGEEQVRAVIEALKPKLAPRAVVVHHDSEHGDDGVKIRRGIEAAGITPYLSLLPAPSDCGLALWRGADYVFEPEPEPPVKTRPRRASKPRTKATAQTRARKK